MEIGGNGCKLQYHDGLLRRAFAVRGRSPYHRNKVTGEVRVQSPPTAARGVVAGATTAAQPVK